MSKQLSNTLEVKKLRRLNDQEFNEVERRARISGTHPDTCPTCGSKLQKDENLQWHREPGHYRLHGEEFACDCETQIALRKHYLLANIPDHYMRLDWEQHFFGSKEVKDVIALYLERWPSFNLNGVGVEFRGSNLGVGKTFAATHLAKELIKRGESVFFIQFQDYASGFDKEELEAKLLETPIVVLDEIVPPYTSNQNEFFASRLESLIRHRTNCNAITFMTTNLKQSQMEKYYPRVYSLMAAKQISIEMNGEDARHKTMSNMILELATNGEIFPLT